MKKYRLLGIYVVTVIIIVSLMSCNSDFLDENPKSFLASDNTFVSTKGFETALNGLYYIFRQEYAFDGYGDGFGMLFAGTDLCVVGVAYPDHVKAENYGTYITPSWTGGVFWSWGYSLIGNANQILENVNNEDVNWDDPSDKNWIEAEARFFRAYAYRDMIYLYGDLPLVTELTKPFSTDFTRQPVSNILDVVIDDLKFAAENLPETTDTDGKLVQAAARHLLAEIYLYADEPALAEEQAKLVIESGNYQLVNERFGEKVNESGDYFSDMFQEHGYNRSSGNMESILVVQFEYNVTGGGAEIQEFQRRAWVPYYSAVSGFALCDSLGGRGVGRLRPLEWWLNAYEAQDIRSSKYNIRRHYWYNKPGDPKYGQEAIMTTELQESGYLYPSTTKFNFGKTADNASYASNHKDRYKFRLAETWLLLAEAQMKQNKLPEAAASINVVRTRANATPVTAADVDMDFILDERARELFAEEDRRFTLCRTGTLLERVRRLNPISGQTIQDFNVLWPIPQTAIDANTGVVLEQNPGY
ncbi:MAG: RagB/SusD family nutrient uptake outer membrane protein [Mangrovibacterium sp.]